MDGHDSDSIWQSFSATVLSYAAVVKMAASTNQTISQSTQQQIQQQSHQQLLSQPSTPLTHSVSTPTRPRSHSHSQPHSQSRHHSNNNSPMRIRSDSSPRRNHSPIISSSPLYLSATDLSNSLAMLHQITQQIQSAVHFEKNINIPIPPDSPASSSLSSASTTTSRSSSVLMQRLSYLNQLLEAVKSRKEQKANEIFDQSAENNSNIPSLSDSSSQTDPMPTSAESSCQTDVDPSIENDRHTILNQSSELARLRSQLEHFFCQQSEFIKVRDRMENELALVNSNSSVTIHAIKAQLEWKTKEVETLTHKNKRTEIQIADIDQIYKAKESKYQKEIEELKESIIIYKRNEESNKSCHNCHSLSILLSQEQASHQKVQSELSRLYINKGTIEEKVEGQQKAIESMEEEIARHKSELKYKESQLISVEEEYNKVKQSNDELSLQLERNKTLQQRQCQQFQSELSFGQMEIQRLAQQLESSLSAIESLELKLKMNSENTNELKDRLRISLAEVDTLREGALEVANQLTAQRNDLEDEKERNEIKISALLESQAKELSDRYAEWCSATVDADREKEALQAQVNACQQELNELKEHEDMLASVFKQKESLFEETKSALHNHQDQIKEYQIKLHSTQMELKELDHSYQQINETMERMEREKENAEQTIQQQSQHILACEHTILSAQRQIEDKELSVQSIKQEVEGLKVSTTELTAKLTLKEGELTELRVKLQSQSVNQQLNRQGETEPTQDYITSNNTITYSDIHDSTDTINHTNTSTMSDMRSPSPTVSLCVPDHYDYPLFNDSMSALELTVKTTALRRGRSIDFAFTQMKLNEHQDNQAINTIEETKNNADDNFVDVHSKTSGRSALSEINDQQREENPKKNKKVIKAAKSAKKSASSLPPQPQSQHQSKDGHSRARSEISKSSTSISNTSTSSISTLQSDSNLLQTLEVSERKRSKLKKQLLKLERIHTDRVKAMDVLCEITCKEMAQVSSELEEREERCIALENEMKQLREEIEERSKSNMEIQTLLGKVNTLSQSLEDKSFIKASAIDYNEIEVIDGKENLRNNQLTITTKLATPVKQIKETVSPLSPFNLLNESFSEAVAVVAAWQVASPQMMRIDQFEAKEAKNKIHHLNKKMIDIKQNHQKPHHHERKHSKSNNFIQLIEEEEEEELMDDMIDPQATYTIADQSLDMSGTTQIDVSDLQILLREKDALIVSLEGRIHSLYEQMENLIKKSEIESKSLNDQLDQEKITFTLAAESHILAHTVLEEKIKLLHSQHQELQSQLQSAHHQWEEERLKALEGKNLCLQLERTLIKERKQNKRKHENKHQTGQKESEEEEKEEEESEETPSQNQGPESALATSPPTDSLSSLSRSSSLSSLFSAFALGANISIRSSSPPAIATSYYDTAQTEQYDLAEASKRLQGLETVKIVRVQSSTQSEHQNSNTNSNNSTSSNSEDSNQTAQLIELQRTIKDQSETILKLKGQLSDHIVATTSSAAAAPKQSTHHSAAPSIDIDTTFNATNSISVLNGNSQLELLDELTSDLMNRIETQQKQLQLANERISQLEQSNSVKTESADGQIQIEQLSSQLLQKDEQLAQHQRYISELVDHLQQLELDVRTSSDTIIRLTDGLSKGREETLGLYQEMTDQRKIIEAQQHALDQATRITDTVGCTSNSEAIEPIGSSRGVHDELKRQEILILRKREAKLQRKFQQLKQRLHESQQREEETFAILQNERKRRMDLASADLSLSLSLATTPSITSQYQSPQSRTKKYNTQRTDNNAKPYNQVTESRIHSTQQHIRNISTVGVPQPLNSFPIPNLLAVPPQSSQHHHHHVPQSSFDYDAANGPPTLEDAPTRQYVLQSLTNIANAQREREMRGMKNAKLSIHTHLNNNLNQDKGIPSTEKVENEKPRTIRESKLKSLSLSYQQQQPHHHQQTVQMAEHEEEEEEKNLSGFSFASAILPPTSPSELTP